MTANASFQIYDILNSSVQPGINTLTCQLGSAVDGSVYTDNAILWQQVGLASLPSISATGQAAQALTMSTGLMDIIVGTRDIRFQSQLGSKFGPGDTFLYATGPEGEGQPRIALSGATGNITLYTTFENAPNGIALGLFVDAANDSIMLVNAVGNGIVIDKTGVHITLAQGVAGMDFYNETKSIQINANGHTQIVGGAILLGTTATVSPANAATIGPAGTFTSGSPAPVQVVPETGTGATTGPVIGTTLQPVSTRVFIGV